MLRSRHIAGFHGYEPAMFSWEDSKVIKYDLPLQVYDIAREMASDIDASQSISRGTVSPSQS